MLLVKLCFYEELHWWNKESFSQNIEMIDAFSYILHLVIIYRLIDQGWRFSSVYSCTSPLSPATLSLFVDTSSSPVSESSGAVSLTLSLLSSGSSRCNCYLCPECSDFSPPVTMMLMIFLCMEGLLFLTFTAVMFSTQLHSICNDETVRTRGDTERTEPVHTRDMWIVNLHVKLRYCSCLVNMESFMFVCCQEIERLKNEKPTWERQTRWAGLRSVFGGQPSVQWMSPFVGLKLPTLGPRRTWRGGAEFSVWWETRVSAAHWPVTILRTEEWRILTTHSLELLVIRTLIYQISGSCCSKHWFYRSWSAPEAWNQITAGQLFSIYQFIVPQSKWNCCQLVWNNWNTWKRV